MIDIFRLRLSQDISQVMEDPCFLMCTWFLNSFSIMHTCYFLVSAAPGELKRLIHEITRRIEVHPVLCRHPFPLCPTVTGSQRGCNALSRDVYFIYIDVTNNSVFFLPSSHDVAFILSAVHKRHRFKMSLAVPKLQLFFFLDPETSSSSC